MRFADTAIISNQVKVSDGMGGWTYSETTQQEIRCCLVQLDALKATKEYGIALNHPIKLYTLEDLPTGPDFQILIQERVYAIKSISQNQPIAAYLLEESR